MAQVLHRELAVFCRNYEAHPLGHFIPIASRFDKPTEVQCDVCRMSWEYRTDDIVIVENPRRNLP